MKEKQREETGRRVSVGGSKDRVGGRLSPVFGARSPQGVMGNTSHTDPTSEWLRCTKP